MGLMFDNEFLHGTLLQRNLKDCNKKELKGNKKVAMGSILDGLHD
jgi:hypothetical protein